MICSKRLVLNDRASISHLIIPGMTIRVTCPILTLQWRHNGRDSISNHQPHDCSLNCLFRRRSKKTSKLRITGLCAGNSPGTGEFPAQMVSYAENVSIWWRHHEYPTCHKLLMIRVHIEYWPTISDPPMNCWIRSLNFTSCHYITVASTAVEISQPINISLFNL